MLNQVTRALAALIRPIAASQKRAGQAEQSSAERDPSGQAYENLHQNQKENPASEPERNDPDPASPELPAGTVTDISEARKRAIASSLSWAGLVTEFEEQKASLGERAGKTTGPSAYEKTSTSSSKVAQVKKGVILDKKAG